MPTLQNCQSDLEQAMENNPNTQNFSNITSQAWGNRNNKTECFKKIGNGQRHSGMKKVQNYIKNYDSQSSKINQMHGAAQKTKQQTNQEQSNQKNKGYEKLSNENEKEKSKKQSQYQTGTKKSQAGFWANTKKMVNESSQELLVGGLSVFAILFLFFLIKYLFPFIYDVFNSNRLQFFEIKLPRGDSKEEREKQKEVAKNMEEKIGRMGQVYRNMHKLGELSVADNILDWLFDKPKISLIYNYKDGNLRLIIGTYPEYRDIIESSLSAQYSEVSIKRIDRPKFFDKKHDEIIPLEPEKDNYYPIRIFKQLEDDPINNILDGMSKVSSEDTLNIMLNIKPKGEKFNKKAQEFADGLYRRDDKYTEKSKWREFLLMPWKLLGFITDGPSDKLIKSKSDAPGADNGDSYVRMVKAKEEALNTMGEEAGKHAFTSGLVITSSSNKKGRAERNVRNVISSYTIYKDEYNNELDHSEIKVDIFGRLFKPLWKLTVYFFVPTFLFKKNIFTVNELASLFHLPDGVFNKSPIIDWMEYKVLAPPQNRPKLEEDSGYRITGVVAEEFRDGDVSKIFADKQDHWAVGTKKEKEENLIPVQKYEGQPPEDKEIIEKDEGKFIKEIETKEKPALKVFNDGVLVGINVYRNKYTPIYMKRDDRTRHHYVVGKSGGGKSVYIASLVKQDIWNGDGVCVIDPHGDLVEDILQYVPKERAKDTIYFDAGNKERPMGLNLYQLDDPDQADRIVNDATEMFIKMFGPEIFGPRIQEYFKYGSLTLLEDDEEEATLIDVPRLFTDDAFRKYKVSKVDNPVVKNFWEKTYASMGEREKKEIIPYFTSKFVSFITNKLIRNIIGQPESAFNFRKVMDEGKILLINLSKGQMGEMNTQLLGMILVSKIYNAAMSRADLPEDQRRDFFLYVDEFQNFASDSFSDILSEARKYRLCLIMAHQYIKQLEGSAGNNIGDDQGGDTVKDAVFGNTGTIQSFKVGAPDAEFLEKEYKPTLSAQDIIGIDKYKFYMKLSIDNSTTRVFSMDSVWTQDYKNEKTREILKEYSAKKYGRKRKFVDAEITARLGMLDEDEQDDDNQDTNDNKNPDSMKDIMQN